MPTSRPRTRLDPAVRRSQIAAAAARVFSEHDPGDVSFEAVADEAGVSRSLVYSYFGDRGGLFAAAYDHELSVLDHELGDALSTLRTDRTQLTRVVDAYLRFASDHPKQWLLIVSASSSRHPAVRAAIRARIEQIAEVIGGGAETKLLVRAVLGLLEAAAVQSLEEPDTMSLDSLTELVVQLLWSGLSSLPDGEPLSPTG